MAADPEPPRLTWLVWVEDNRSTSGWGNTADEALNDLLRQVDAHAARTRAAAEAAHAEIEALRRG